MTTSPRNVRIILVGLVVVAIFAIYHWSHPNALGNIIGGEGSDHTMNWADIPIREKPAANLMHDKWIVITTINYPTSDVKKLASIPGWKVVIVGDTKSPKNWR